MSTLHTHYLVIGLWEGGFFYLVPRFPEFPPPQPAHETERHNKNTTTMEVAVAFGKEKYTIEVGENDTTKTMRQKVATATGLCEDSFHMGFGGKDEGGDITELSAGDTVVLKETKRAEATAALRALGETDLTAKGLQQATDPKVACLLIQAEVATRLPDSFLSGNEKATHIDLSCVSVVKEIGPKCLYECSALTTVDLSGMCAVTAIGDSFLEGCTALSTIDLSGLRSVTTIGFSFLAKCEKLSTLDLSALRGVTAIPKFFLTDCKSLTTVDFTGFSAVTAIGDGFLTKCTALSSIDLTDMRAVTVIGQWFLFDCTALSTIDLTGFEAVTSIGAAFMGCTALSTIDLTGLRSVTKIGIDFLCNCKELKTVHGQDKCSRVVLSRALDSLPDSDDTKRNILMVAPVLSFAVALYLHNTDKTLGYLWMFLTTCVYLFSGLYDSPKRKYN